MYAVPRKIPTVRIAVSRHRHLSSGGMTDRRLPQPDEPGETTVAAVDRDTAKRDHLRGEYLLAEFAFITDGMRQDQRERVAVLGFALAASSAVLGLLVHQTTKPPSSAQGFILLGIALAITLVAELMTIRATIGVASGGHYLRLFIESEVVELRFQTRRPHFLAALGAQSTKRLPRSLLRSSVHAASGFAIAYGVLTVGLVIAWFSVDLSTARDLWQSVLVVGAGCVNVGLAGQLWWWTAHSGARYLRRAWDKVAEESQAASGDI